MRGPGTDSASAVSGRAVRVAVVDGHPWVRAGVAAVLDPCGDMELVAAGGSVHALASHTGVVPDVVVLEPYLAEDLAGDAAVKAVRELGYGVVVLTAVQAPARLRALVNAGAEAVLFKTGDIAELPSAVRAVVAGKTLMSPTVELRLAAQPQRSGWLDLAPELEEVRALLAQGCDNRTIAQERRVSLSTVKNQVRRIRAAYAAAGIEVASRADLCRAAARKF